MQTNTTKPVSLFILPAFISLISLFIDLKETVMRPFQRKFAFSLCILFVFYTFFDKDRSRHRFSDTDEAALIAARGKNFVVITATTGVIDTLQSTWHVR